MLTIWSLVPLPFLNPAEHLEVYGSRTVEAWLGEFSTLFCYHVRWVQLYGSLSILWHCLSLGLEWRLTFSSPVATAEFSKFAGILSIYFHTTSSFRIWNSSTGIPSPPLALFVVMLAKAHLTSHSRMSGIRSVIKPSWLSDFRIDHLVMSLCRVLSCVFGRGCLLWAVCSLVWRNRQIWPWSTKWSRTRLAEFCQENILVTVSWHAHTVLFKVVRWTKLPDTPQLFAHCHLQSISGSPQNFHIVL